MLKQILNRLFKSEDLIFPQSLSISVAKNFSIGRYRNIQVHKNALLEISENVSFREFCNILIFKNAKLKISNNVFFNNYCSINCIDKIEIGENTIFGEGVKIYDHNHKHSYENEQLKTQVLSFNTAPVVIGKNCWIASNVTILKGVNIGDNTIIGAHNLIYKSVPPNKIIKAVINTI